MSIMTDMCDIPAMSEEADAVADMLLMSIEVEDAIAMVLVAMSMLRLSISSFEVARKVGLVEQVKISCGLECTVDYLEGLK
jgi:hypothetical protein